MSVDLEKAVRFVMRATDWQEDVARRFVAAVSPGADDPAHQLRQLTGWAVETERRMVMLDLLKRLAPGMIEIRWDGSDAGFRLAQGVEVTRTPKGWQVKRNAQ